jgi:hypothetical protein
MRLGGSESLVCSCQFSLSQAIDQAAYLLLMLYALERRSDCGKSLYERAIRSTIFNGKLCAGVLANEQARS